MCHGANLVFHSRVSYCIKQWESMGQRHKRIQAKHSSRCHSDGIIAIYNTGTGLQRLRTISYAEKSLPPVAGIFHVSEIQRKTHI